MLTFPASYAIIAGLRLVSCQPNIRKPATQKRQTKQEKENERMYYEIVYDVYCCKNKDGNYKLVEQSVTSFLSIKVLLENVVKWNNCDSNNGIHWVYSIIKITHTDKPRAIFPDIVSII